MKTKQIYMRFLNLLHTLEGGEHAPSMDLDAKKLLEFIAMRHEQQKPLTVTEAMALSTIASPATIHRKLDQLRELGMIDTVFEGKNRRTKYLVPTQAAHDYFEHIGQAMQAWRGRVRACNGVLALRDRADRLLRGGLVVGRIAEREELVERLHDVGDERGRERHRMVAQGAEVVGHRPPGREGRRCDDRKPML